MNNIKHSETGSYTQIVMAHDWAVKNGWICQMRYIGGETYQLVVFGKATS